MTTPDRDVRTVGFNLGRLMRENRVALRELKARTGITLKRLRQIRAMDYVSYSTYCDLTQAVTGQNVFDPGYYAKGL